RTLAPGAYLSQGQRILPSWFKEPDPELYCRLCKCKRFAPSSLPVCLLPRCTQPRPTRRSYSPITIPETSQVSNGVAGALGQLILMKTMVVVCVRSAYSSRRPRPDTWTGSRWFYTTRGVDTISRGT